MEVTPDGRRLLYTDPAAAAPLPCVFHKLDQVGGATVQLVWPAANTLSVNIDAQDGARVHLELQLAETLGCRILAAMSRSSRLELAAQPAMLRLAAALTDLLATRGGACLGGATETGRHFLGGRTDRLLLVTGGSGAENGRLLGPVTEPREQVRFGDTVPTRRPLLMIGDFLLEYPEAR